MSLTPKNWHSFQHYKDRAPPWIKLHRGLLDNVEFQRLPIASRALAPMLWLLSAEFEGGKITDDFSAISWRLRITLEDLMQGLNPLLEKGFFVSDEFASATLAECQRAAMPEREKEAEEKTETDTRSIEADRPVSAQIDLEEAIAKAKPRSAPSRFDEFWQAYPRREGANPRAPAEKKFNSLVKSGVDPEMMIVEARKLAGTESGRGNIGTRFIPQAITWLNQQRWSDHAAVAFLVEQAGGEMPIEVAVKFFAKNGFWSRHAGMAPGEPGCKASPELLAKYGLMPDGRKMQPPEAA